MIMNVAKNEHINGFSVSELCCNVFVARKGNLTIRFIAEGRNGGTYTRIETVTNKNRCYTAQRYHYKYVGIVQSIGHELLMKNLLWDYIEQCPALESYEKAIKPYHDKCKQLGISF